MEVDQIQTRCLENKAIGARSNVQNWPQRVQLEDVLENELTLAVFIGAKDAFLDEDLGVHLVQMTFVALEVGEL